MQYAVAVLMLFFSLIACGKPLVDKSNLHTKISRTHVSRNITYAEARKYLFGDLHYDNGIVADVYCGQSYDNNQGVGKGRIPDPKFLNCEHTWPQSKFEGSESSVMKVDLHHLFPVNSKSNSARSNHPFGEIDTDFNVCNSSKLGQIHETGETGFEPPDNHKGNVARALFYFSTRYDLPIDSVQESYLRKWHDLDPVDDFERNRNLRIKQIQGNINPFIVNPEYVDEIEDF